MNRERWNLLMTTDSEKLSDDEISQGWHFCDDWDGLLIGPGMGEMEACECRNWSREVAKQADELLAVSEAFYKFRVAVAAKLGLANCDTPVLLAELDRLRVACKEIASLLQTMRAECDELRAKCETESRAATYWWRAYMALAKGSCPEPTIEGDRQAVKEFEDYEKQLSWIADSLAGVQGALADAGGEILCIREDGNYGESVRQIVGERDSLRAKLAEAEAKVGKMLELHRHVEAAHVFCSECERIAKGA